MYVILKTSACTAADRRGPDRRAFTLVELMVAMALIVFIMSILSTAFVAGSKAFTDMKAAGDLAEKLRGAMTLLRRDLAAPHFEPNSKKLSDPDFWVNNTGSTQTPNNQALPGNQPFPPALRGIWAYGPPQGGFVRIFQGVEPNPPGDALPQPDKGAIQGPTGTRLGGARPRFVLNGEIPSYVASQSMLHFTVVLPGVLPGDFFNSDLASSKDKGAAVLSSPNLNQDRRFQIPASQGGTVFQSQQAEVVWWLRPSLMPDGKTQATTFADANQTPQLLWTLCRRQRLLWPENTIVQAAAGAGMPGSGVTGYEEVSIPATPASPPLPAANNMIQVNRMSEVSIPAFRLGMDVDRTPYAAGAIAGNKQTTPAGVFQQGGIYPPYTTNGFPADILLDNVLSFSVRVLLAEPSAANANNAANPNNTAFPTASNPNNTTVQDFMDLSDPTVQAYSMGNPQFTMGNPQFKGWVFDTWSQQNVGKYNYGMIDSTDTPVQYPAWLQSAANSTFQIPLFRKGGLPNSKNLNASTSNELIRIMAIQVTLRLYDAQHQTTRQVTMVQAM